MLQAPAKANSAIGVKVEGGPKGCIYVKVHCADRRGLLADIIAALKSMPLEVRQRFLYPIKAQTNAHSMSIASKKVFIRQRKGAPAGMWTLDISFRTCCCLGCLAWQLQMCYWGDCLLHYPQMP